jgi:uncharacterized protein YggU (UPF0235/DUF167 family)
LPFRAIPGGASLAVRLTPRGGRDAIEGVVVDATGAKRLKARVAAPPEDGKANAALIALLAKSLKIPRSRIALIGGATDRNKVFRIDGADATDLARLIQPRKA